MEKIIYWAFVTIGDDGIFVKVNKDDYREIISFANKGYAKSYESDDESRLIKTYVIDNDGRKKLVAMKQHLM